MARLDVHFDEHQTVVTAEGQKQSALAQGSCDTELTEWFKANENYPEAHHVRYADFSKYLHGVPITSDGNREHVLGSGIDYRRKESLT